MLSEWWPKGCESLLKDKFSAKKGKIIKKLQNNLVDVITIFNFAPNHMRYFACWLLYRRQSVSIFFSKFQNQ